MTPDGLEPLETDPQEIAALVERYRCALADAYEASVRLHAGFRVRGAGPDTAPILPPLRTPPA